MSGQLPIATPTRLIVLMAFDRDDEGNLHPAFEAREMPDEARAKRTAHGLKNAHAGVIAWSRQANPALGEFGAPEVLAVYGECRTWNSCGPLGTKGSRECAINAIAAFPDQSKVPLRNSNATLK